MLLAVTYCAILLMLATYSLTARITRWRGVQEPVSLDQYFLQAFLDAVERGDHAAADHYAGAWLSTARGTLHGPDRAQRGQRGQRHHPRREAA